MPGDPVKVRVLFGLDLVRKGQLLFPKGGDIVANTEPNDHMVRRELQCSIFQSGKILIEAIASDAKVDELIVLAVGVAVEIILVQCMPSALLRNSLRPPIPVSQHSNAVGAGWLAQRVFLIGQALRISAKRRQLVKRIESRPKLIANPWVH